MSTHFCKFLLFFSIFIFVCHILTFFDKFFIIFSILTSCIYSFPAKQTKMKYASAEIKDLPEWDKWLSAPGRVFYIITTAQSRRFHKWP